MNLELEEQISKKIEKELTLNGIHVRKKQDIWWHRILDKILFFVPGYLDKFSNAFDLKHLDVAERTQKSPTRWEIIVHECRHMVDMKLITVPLFAFLWTFPQNLFLLAFLAPFTSNWMWFFLLALLPWPAPGRAWLESRAYAMNVAIKFGRLYRLSSDMIHVAEDLDDYKRYVIGELSGASYYFAMPYRPLIRYWLDKYSTEFSLHVFNLLYPLGKDKLVLSLEEFQNRRYGSLPTNLTRFVCDALIMIREDQDG